MKTTLQCTKCYFLSVEKCKFEIRYSYALSKEIAANSFSLSLRPLRGALLHQDNCPSGLSLLRHLCSSRDIGRRVPIRQDLDVSLYTTVNNRLKLDTAISIVIVIAIVPLA